MAFPSLLHSKIAIIWSSHVAKERVEEVVQNRMFCYISVKLDEYLGNRYDKSA